MQNLGINTLRYHGETAHPPPTPRPIRPAPLPTLGGQDYPAIPSTQFIRIGRIWLPCYTMRTPHPPPGLPFPSALALYQSEIGRKREACPPPHPRGARLPCNTVHTVQPVRAILITLQYPAIPAERRRQGGRGPNFPDPPALRRSASAHYTLMSLIIIRISNFRQCYNNRYGAPPPYLLL